MSGDTEAAGELRVGAKIASLELKNFATPVTSEVVMMCLASDLIAQSFAGHGDGGKPVALQQCANVAINRSNTQAFYLGLRRGENLFRRKRPVGPLKSFPDRRFLTGVSRLYGQGLLLDARVRS